MNIVLNNQSDSNLVDNCPLNSLQISCKSLNIFIRFQKSTTTKSPKFVKFSEFNFKIVYLTRFSSDFNFLGLKILNSSCSAQNATHGSIQKYGNYYDESFSSVVNVV